MTKRVLVTGVSGYIAGRFVERAADEGWDVIGLSRRPAGERSGCEVVVSDWSVESLEDVVQRCSPSVVVHLASKYHWRSTTDVFEELIDANLVAPLRLWNACRARVDRFVAVGSYFESLRRASGSHVNLYSGIKEAFANIAQESYGEEALPQFVEVQMADVYGPGDPRRKLIPVALEAAFNGGALPVSDLTAQIYPLHVDDAASAIMTAASAETAPGRYSLDVEPRTISQVLDTIERLVGPVDVVAGSTRPGLRAVQEWPRLPGWSPTVSLRDGLAGLMDSIR